MIHGAGGGFDQGLGFGEAIVRRGVRVVAPSRFGYLRTPLPGDASVEAQADAQRRVQQVLARILPVSARADGLLNDAKVVTSLRRSELERIAAPTLAISVEDDLFGTHASAAYTASQVRGARFLSFAKGGHVWAGHDAEVADTVATFVKEHP